MDFIRQNKAALAVIVPLLVAALAAVIFVSASFVASISATQAKSAEDDISFSAGMNPAPAPDGLPGDTFPVEPRSPILVDQVIDLDGYEPGIAGFDIQPETNSAVVMIALEEEAYAIFLEAANLLADTSAERIQLTKATVSHWFGPNTIRVGIDNYQGKSFDDPPTEIFYELVVSNHPVKSVDFLRDIPAPIEWAPTSEKPGVEMPDPDKD